MLQRIEAPCPGCRAGRLMMDVSVNDHGSQTFSDGQTQHEITCDHCGTRALVTLNAGQAPTVTRVPTPPEHPQQGRGHSTHR